MAGVTGFEPVPTVLETAVLPLTPYSYKRINKYSIEERKNAIENRKIEEKIKRTPTIKCWSLFLFLFVVFLIFNILENCFLFLSGFFSNHRFTCFSFLSDLFNNKLMEEEDIG